MPQNSGKKITLFLVDGEPDGLKTLELDGWNGIGIVFPRNKLKEFAVSDHAGKSGVYFLFGRESEDSLVFTVYIGHAGNIIDRLNTHNSDKSKEFWRQTVAFASIDDSLTPSRAKYIESRCLSQALEAKHFGYKLIYGNEPKPGHPPKVDIPGMEVFLENLNLLLATIGYPILQKIESKAKDDKDNPLFFCQNRDGIAKGTARMTNEGFIVYKGSVVAAQFSDAIAERNTKLINRLLAEGAIKKNEDLYVFENNYNFIKPSAPAELIMGYPVSGWNIWKTADGKTLKEVYQQ